MRSTESENFMDYVHYLAKNNDGFMFPTKNLEEAAIVMAEIFKYSGSVVQIYDNCLNGDISNQNYIFHARLHQFLKNGKKLEIVLKNEDQPDSKIFNDLVEYSETFPEQIELKVASKEFKRNMLSILKNDVNFIVSDNNAFRLELSERDTTSSSAPVDAVCSFNNEIISQKLKNIFDKGIFDNCKNVKAFDFA